MRVADLVVSWALVLAGIVQLSATHHEWKPETVWYFGAGLLTVLIGAVNLVRIRYAYTASGLRWFTMIADVLYAAYAYALGRATVLGPQIVIAIVAVAAAVLSLRRGEAHA